MRLSTGHPLTRGLEAAWLMTEQGGTLLWDSGPRRCPVTLVGGSWAAGGIRPGAAGYVQTTLDVSALAAFSVVTRVRTGVLAPAGNYVLDGGTVQLGAELDDGYFRTYAAGPVAQEARANDVCDSDAWIHLVGTHGGGVNRLYVDGKLHDEVAAGAVLAGASATLGLGWDGYIDFMLVYGRALSPAEVFWLAADPWIVLERGRVRRV